MKLEEILKNIIRNLRKFFYITIYPIISISKINLFSLLATPKVLEVELLDLAKMLTYTLDFFSDISFFKRNFFSSQHAYA